MTERERVVDCLIERTVISIMLSIFKVASMFLYLLRCSMFTPHLGVFHQHPHTMYTVPTPHTHIQGEAQPLKNVGI